MTDTEQKMAGAFRLACGTTDDAGECQYAVIEMSPHVARHLLQLREAFKAAKAAFHTIAPRGIDSDFYKVELWDYSPQFFGGMTGSPVDDFGGQWLTLPDGVVLTKMAPGDTMRLAIKDDGVLWYAYHKHGGPEFETEKLEWAALEGVAGGHQPFGALGEEDEDETKTT